MSPGQVIRAAWQQLGPAALGYRSLTASTGVPSTRAGRTLLTRMLEPETKHVVETSAAIDDPATIADVVSQIGRHRERMERLVSWHIALRRAYRELAGDRPFLKDAVEQLFAPAWDATYDREPADAEARAVRALEIVSALRDDAHPFSLIEVDRLLSDPAVVRELDREVAEAWRGRVVPGPLSRGDAVPLTNAVIHLGAVIVPTRGAIRPEADEYWRVLREDPRAAALVSAASLGLSTEKSPRPPAVSSTAESFDDEWIAPFRALDASLRERLARILQNPTAPWPATLTASSALTRSSRVAAEPLGLGTTAGRAALVVASILYQGIGASADERRAELQPGAVAYLAACWRRSEGVTAVLARGYGGFASSLADFVAHPLDYVFGRLWIRLSRSEYYGEQTLTTGALWDHLKTSVVSSSGHVRALAKRIARQNLSAAFQGLAAAQDVSDDRMESRLDLAERLLDRVGSRSTFRVVVRHALRLEGVAAVDGYLSALGGLARERADERELEERWSGWVHAVARERAARSRGDLRDDDVYAERVRAELGGLPAYAQARAQVRSRLAAWVAGQGDRSQRSAERSTRREGERR